MNMPAENNDNYSDELVVRPLDGWSEAFWNELVPLKNRIVGHPLFTEMAKGELPVACFRHALLNFYPLVENFPKYMALSLAKVDLTIAGHEEAKNWLIENIRIEKRHAYWYEDWGAGFGFSARQMREVVPPPAMNAINHYLWDCCRTASLEESLAASNLAIEWATGEWTKAVVDGMKAYHARGDMDASRRTLAWLRAHATYDDHHPYEAMELVRRIARSAEQQAMCLEAARQGMSYYLLALDHSYSSHVEAASGL